MENERWPPRLLRLVGVFKIARMGKPRKKLGNLDVSFFVNFEVWVKDFKVFDLRFGFSTPKSPRGRILR